MASFSIDIMSLDEFWANYRALYTVDYEGAFALHNRSRNLWYFDSSPRVFHTLFGMLTGQFYGYDEIYACARAGDDIIIRTADLRKSVYRDRRALYIALYEAYSAGRIF